MIQPKPYQQATVFLNKGEIIMKMKDFVMPKRLNLDYIQATLNDWNNIESYNLEREDGQVDIQITNFYDRAILACLNLVKFYSGVEGDELNELIIEISSMNADKLTDVYYKLIKINGWAVLEKAYEQEAYTQNYNKRETYRQFMKELDKINEALEENQKQLEEEEVEAATEITEG